MTNPAEGTSVAVVVAMIDARASLLASLARFREEALALGGELVVVDSSADGSADLAGGWFPDFRLLRRPAGRLAPELWRDGLLATRSALVAFSTAQMVPSPGWLAALRGRLEASGASGVGGPIAPVEGLNGTDRAVAMLRYANYWPEFPDPGRVEPPVDNALYRRDRLDAVAGSWGDGFREVDVHRALRERGDALAMAEDAVVSSAGGSTLSGMLGQRWRHGRIYGKGRANGIGFAGRIARTLRMPLVPPLMVGRIVAGLRSRDRPIGPWLPAAPALLALATAWSMGEAAGAWDAIQKPDPRHECIEVRA